MEKVLKFTTFADLKAADKAVIDPVLSEKRHEEFLKVLKEIKAIKDQKIKKRPI